MCLCTFMINTLCSNNSKLVCYRYWNTNTGGFALRTLPPGDFVLMGEILS